MTGMETKRARGKCIANALICQVCWTFLWKMVNEAGVVSEMGLSSNVNSEPYARLLMYISANF